MKKKEVSDVYYRQMLERAMMMFKYEDLPESIPEYHLERYLLEHGSCCIAKVNGELYALLGSEGGELDAYYQPTQYIVANPALNLSKAYTIGKDCVLCKNSKNKYPISKVIRKSTDIMAENYVSMRRVLFNSRIKFIPTAKDEDTYNSILHFLEGNEEGDLIPIMDKAFLESLSVVDISQTAGDQMIPYIELQQYVKGTLLNDLGINANYNMKREALSANEVGLNEDALLPFVENMLNARREFIDQVNEMYGTDIKVDFASIWKSNVIERVARVEEITQTLESEEVEEVGGESTSGEVVLDEGEVDGTVAENVEEFSRLNPEENDTPVESEPEPEESGNTQDETNEPATEKDEVEDETKRVSKDKQPSK